MDQDHPNTILSATVSCHLSEPYCRRTYEKHSIIGVIKKLSSELNQSNKISELSGRSKPLASSMPIYQALLRPGAEPATTGDDLHIQLMSYIETLSLNDNELSRLERHLKDLVLHPDAVAILRFLFAVASHRVRTRQKTPRKNEEKIFDCPMEMLDGSAFKRPHPYLLIPTDNTPEIVQTFDSLPGSHLKLSENFFNIYGVPTEKKLPKEKTPESEIPAVEAEDNWLQAAALGPPPPHRTWERLGLGELWPEQEKPLLTELHAPQASKSLVMQRIVQDIVFLLQGISSGCFPFSQERKQFEIADDFAVDWMSRGVFDAILVPLLKCGMDYRRLEQFVAMAPSDISRSPLIQALQLAASKYLELHRESCQRLVAQRYVGLLQLSSGVGLLGPALAAVAQLCRGPQSGLDLLERVSHLAKMVPPGRTALVLYSLLKRVVDTYFRILNKWLFDGEIDEAGAADLFVQPQSELLASRSRRFWTQGFLLRESLLPSFLHGLQDDLLLCGKTVHLLKLCRPKDPLLCELLEDRPSLQCCLQPSELSEMQQAWRTYSERVRKATGSLVTAASQLEVEERGQVVSIELASHVREERLKEIRASQRAERAAHWEAQQQLAQQLRQQMREVEARKAELQQQEQREEEERRLIVQEQQRQVDQRVAQEREAMLAHYEELSRASTRRLELAERKVERLRHEMEVTESAGLDDINSNSPAQEKTPEILVKDANANLNVPANARKVPTHLPLTKSAHLADQVKKVSHTKITESTKVSTSTNTSELYKVAQAEAARNKNKVLSQELNLITNVCETSSTTDTQNNATTNDNEVLTRNKENLNELGPRVDNIGAQNFLTACAEATRNKARAKEHEWGTTAPHTDDLRKLSTQHSHETILSLKNDNSPDSASGVSLQSPSHEGPIHQSDKGRSSSSVPHSAMSMSVDSATSLKTDLETPTGTYPSAMSVSMETSSCDNLLSPDSATSGTESKTTLDTPVDVVPRKKMPTSASAASFLSALSMLSEPLKYRGSVSSDNLHVGAKKVELSLNNVGHLLHEAVALPLATQLKLVNQSVLNLFLQDEQLLTHLYSLRQYFLLLDGEFARKITENLCTGMQQNRRNPKGLINFVALNNILRNALTCSLNGCKDSNAERLSLSTRFVPESFHLRDTEALGCVQLQYQVAWPLCLVLSSEAMQHYDQLFTFLLGLRRGSWATDEAFQWLQTPPDDVNSKLLFQSWQYHQLRLFRHEMGNFMQALHHYFMNASVLKNWDLCKKYLKSATTFDELYKAHAFFVKKVKFCCLLHREASEVQKLIQAVLHSILKFHGTLTGSEWRFSEGDYEHPEFAQLESIQVKFKSRIKCLLRQMTKLAGRGYQPTLFELLHSLNMNDYYQLNL